MEFDSSSISQYFSGAGHYSSRSVTDIDNCVGSQRFCFFGHPLGGECAGFVHHFIVCFQLAADQCFEGLSNIPVVMSWCFKDEANQYADTVLEKLATGRAMVPAIWSLATPPFICPSSFQRPAFYRNLLFPLFPAYSTFSTIAMAQKKRQRETAPCLFYMIS